jgi:selenoprotein W-related protein
VGLADELLREFEHTIDRLVLVPSDGGRFEVSVNGELLYSKLQTRRHAEPGEIMKLVRRMVEA